MRAGARASRATWRRTCRSTPPRRRARYLNAGQALPAAESRQVEIGIKGGAENAEWSAAAFDIRRPLFGDIASRRRRAATCSARAASSATSATSGVEGSLAWRGGAWALRAGAQWLHARVEGASDPTLDGKRADQRAAPSRRACRSTGSVPAIACRGLRLLAGRHVRERAHGAARQQRPDPEL